MDYLLPDIFEELKMFVVWTTRWLFLGSALLLFANVTFGQGAYQHTKDGKTFVWNSEPKSGDEATWSGGRDDEDYASGFGTLTWYSARKETVKHLGIQFSAPTVYARYFGNMVHGKFNGPVNVHSKGKTNHAIFTDGVRTTRWGGGPAPAQAGAEQLAALPVKEKAKVAKATQKSVASARPVSPSAETAASSAGEEDSLGQSSGEPGKSEAARTVAKKEETQPSTLNRQQQTEAPAEGPIQRTEDRDRKSEVGDQKSDVRDEMTEVGEQKTEVRGQRSEVSDQRTEVRGQTDEPKASVESLVGPPSTLHTNPAATNASSSGSARLTKEEVVDLADAEARSRGYHPAEYQRLDPQYNSADEVWSISYDRISADEMAETAKHFSVTIDDKTKGTVFVPGK